MWALNSHPNLLGDVYRGILFLNLKLVTDTCIYVYTSSKLYTIWFLILCLLCVRCLQVYMCADLYMCVTLSVLLRNSIHLLLRWGLSVRLDWVASTSSGSTSLHLPAWWMEGHGHTRRFSWGFWRLHSCLQSDADWLSYLSLTQPLHSRVWEG